MKEQTERAGQPEVVLRAAKVPDAEAVHALASELAEALGDSPPKPAAVRERLGELLEAPGAGLLVAEVEGEVVGVVSYWIKPDLAHGDSVVEIPMLAVSEGYRRGGVGRALLAAVTERASEADAALVELVATPSNVAAREFYRSLGFVETDHIVLEFVGEIEDLPDVIEDSVD